MQDEERAENRQQRQTRDTSNSKTKFNARKHNNGPMYIRKHDRQVKMVKKHMAEGKECDTSCLRIGYQWVSILINFL